MIVFNGSQGDSAIMKQVQQLKLSPMVSITRALAAGRSPNSTLEDLAWKYVSDFTLAAAASSGGRSGSSATSPARRSPSGSGTC